MAPDDPIPAIRALGPQDAEAYRALRLAALAISPEAFGSSYEEEAALPLESFQARVENTGRSAVFGAFAGDLLIGMAGFRAIEALKQRHKGTLWGVFTEPHWRGRGLGERLVGRVIEHAAQHVQVLQAAVVTTNHGARRMYHRLGFVPYGIERNALRIDGIFYDDALLALDLGQPRTMKA
jgi:RimJ/RimL family protein N-acetyltransferase